MCTPSWRWLAAIVIALAPAKALAFGVTPQPQRILSDPANLPLEGQLLGSTSYSYGTGSHNTYDSSGALISTVGQRANDLTQTFSYGLTDDLSLDGAITYVPLARTESDLASGSMLTRHRDGFSDPKFGITWRAIDQRSAPVNLDFGASYSPDMFDARASTATMDGTVGRGGTEFHTGVALSRTMQDFTIMGRFDADHKGARKVLNPVSLMSTSVDPSWTYTLGLYTQTRFGDRFSLNANVRHSFRPDDTVFSQTSGLGHVVRLGDATGFGAALNYQIVPNRLVSSLTYDHRSNGDTANVFATSPGANTTVKNQDENVIGVRFDYAFN